MPFMTLDQYTSQLRRWGVKFAVLPGAGTRGRPGAHSTPRGIVKHHTGSDAGQGASYLDFLFIKGRPEDGIPGPLCNVATAMSGLVTVGAVGRANHAGKGSSRTLARVIAGTAPTTGELKPGPDDVDGNAVYYGDEVMYDGGQPMTAAARRNSLLHDAAVCEFHGWNAGHVIGHREHTGRKNDPGHESMATWRRDLQALLNAGPPGSNELEELTMADIKAITDALNKIANTQKETLDLLRTHVTSENGRYKQYMPQIQEIDAEGDQGRAQAAQALASISTVLAQLGGQVAALNEKLEPKS